MRQRLAIVSGWTRQSAAAVARFTHSGSLSSRADARSAAGIEASPATIRRSASISARMRSSAAKTSPGVGACRARGRVAILSALRTLQPIQHQPCEAPGLLCHDVRGRVRYLAPKPFAMRQAFAREGGQSIVDRMREDPDRRGVDMVGAGHAPPSRPERSSPASTVVRSDIEGYFPSETAEGKLLRAVVTSLRKSLRDL